MRKYLRKRRILKTTKIKLIKKKILKEKDMHREFDRQTEEVGTDDDEKVSFYERN